MKEIFLLIIAFSNLLIAQEVQKVEIIKTDDQISNLFDQLGTNEIKLDLIDIIAYPAFDINYEKIKNPYNSFGASLFINFSSEQNSDWVDKFSLTPYYRFYFFNKKDFGGAGFFAEVFSKFSSGRTEYNIYYEVQPSGFSRWESETINQFDIALGASIGQKWVNKMGWTFEVNFGVGRFITNNQNEDYNGYYSRPEATLKGGLSLGKRF
tara:strand:+ start:659 stop:1285 length:627 start_codon:yes stop_codon:yes gene_type:complete